MRQNEQMEELGFELQSPFPLHLTLEEVCVAKDHPDSVAGR